MRDWGGAVWRPDEAPRRPLLELGFASPPSHAARRLWLVRGPADPDLLDDLSDPPLRMTSARDRDPASMLFVSDVTAELTAARGAGLQVLLSIRPGNAAQPGADQFETVTSFDEIA